MKRIAIISTDRDATIYFKLWIGRNIPNGLIIAQTYNLCKTQRAEYRLVRSMKDCVGVKFDGYFVVGDYDDAAQDLERYIHDRLG